MTTEEKKQPTPKLPRLRQGITFDFGDYDLDGKPQWLIHDAGRNKFFVIGWAEYELLKRWDIGDPEQLVEAVNTETTLHVEWKDLENLLHFLSYNYLIVQKDKQIEKHAKDQKLIKEDNIFHWLIRYYLFFRIPLAHPDNFLSRTKSVATVIFSRYTVYIMLCLLAVALYQLSFQWEDFIHTFPSIFSLEGLITYFIAFVFCKFCHELGHAYMCKRYGVPVPTLGVAFLVFWPVLYTDTTLSWKLRSKQRLRISLAGIWVETYVTIFALLLWLNTDNLTLKSICYVTVVINWVGSMLINASPFMRFDGYYILSDLLKMPNLQPRAFALTRWQIRRWLFGWSDPPPENFSIRMHVILVAYSLATWLYRLVLYFGIALLVYHYFFKALGIILFGIELYVFMLSPFVNEVRTWIMLKDRFTLNINTRITIIITTFLIIMFFVPLSTSIRLTGTLRYTHKFLYAQYEGILVNSLPPSGTVVKKDQIITQINSLDINQSLAEVNLTYKKSLSELRRAAINPEYSHQQNILLSDIAKEEAENIQLLKQRETLTIRAPFNGIIVDSAEDLKPGTFVQKDEWLADIVDLKTAEIEAYVDEIDRNRIKLGAHGYFYPTNFSESATPVMVTTIETLNVKQLDCRYSTELVQDTKQDMVVATPCYTVNELGGNIAAYMTEEGDYVPVEAVYQVLLTPLKKPELNHIQVGTIILKTTPQSYAYRLVYFLKKILVQESGF